MSCTSPLTVPMRNVPTGFVAGLGQQRAQDVERALHGARGDQHLGHEVVAALEAGADLLERRDQRVEEHRLRARARPRAPGSTPLEHAGRVAHQRLLVEEPGGSRRGSCGVHSLGTVAERARRAPVACLMTSGRSSASRRGESRSVGPDTLSAATTAPPPSKHGRGDRGEAGLELVDRRREAVARGSRSSSRASTRAVDDGARGERARAAVGQLARRRRPAAPCRSPMQWYGTRRPTHCVVPRKCRPSTWATCCDAAVAAARRG